MTIFLAVSFFETVVFKPDRATYKAKKLPWSKKIYGGKKLNPMSRTKQG
jgi:hypothetical protein